jgi:hypothetical protein
VVFGAVPAASSAFPAARPARSGGVAALLPCSDGGVFWQWLARWTPVVAARLWVVAGSGRPDRVLEVGGFELTTAALIGVANPPEGVVRETLSLVWWFRAKAQ